MLQQVCEYIHNMFIQAPNPGTYSITGGVISPTVPLLDGQRFWLVGSALNDGVYTWHAQGIKDDDDAKAVTLADETFDGSVCALAVPRDVLQLVGDVNAWITQYGAAADSPYQSENVIGVYSYTKKTGSGTGSSADADTWQGHFKSRLDRWRKVSF